ncbi:MAG: hypothetical protein CMJ54_12415 [Planctomycetaceae bacterium]|nr:hypothetical protein [Planctomycetaceae bacterium]
MPFALREHAMNAPNFESRRPSIFFICQVAAGRSRRRMDDCWGMSISPVGILLRCPTVVSPSPGTSRSCAAILAVSPAWLVTPSRSGARWAMVDTVCTGSRSRSATSHGDGPSSRRTSRGGCC